MREGGWRSAWPLGLSAAGESLASRSFCSWGVFDIKPFFTWAALLLVEISSHRELNVKVVL